MRVAVIGDLVVRPYDVNFLRRNIEVKPDKSAVVAYPFYINISDSNIGIVIVGNLVIAPLNVIGVRAGYRWSVLGLRVNLAGLIRGKELIVQLLLCDICISHVLAAV